MTYDPPVFEQNGFGYIRRTPDEVYNLSRFVDDGGDRELTKTDKNRFVTYFGVSSEICSLVWDMLDPHENMPKGVEPKHLLWGLLFVKVYFKELVLAGMVGCPDEKTFRKWSSLFVYHISWLEPEIVSDGVDDDQLCGKLT